MESEFVSVKKSVKKTEWKGDAIPLSLSFRAGGHLVGERCSQSERGG